MSAAHEQLRDEHAAVVVAFRKLVHAPVAQSEYATPMRVASGFT